MVFTPQTQAAYASNPDFRPLVPGESAAIAPIDPLCSPAHGIAPSEIAPEAHPAAAQSSAEALPVVLYHELQTTIHLLLNLTDLLLQDAPADSPHIDYLQSLHQGTEQLLGLIDPSEQHPQTVNLHRLLKTLYNLLLPEALNRGLVLRLELDETLPEYLKLRPNRLRRLLLTLMSHGIAHARGIIHLRASLAPCLDPSPQLILEILTPSSLVAHSIEAQLALDLSQTICQELGGQIQTVDGGVRLSIPVTDIEPLTTLGSGQSMGQSMGQMPTSAATLTLQVSDLAVMPLSWRQQLHQASLEGRDRQLQALIDQIPPRYPSLIAAIESLVEQCHWDVLLQLVNASLANPSPRVLPEGQTP